MLTLGTVVSFQFDDAFRGRAGPADAPYRALLSHPISLRRASTGGSGLLVKRHLGHRPSRRRQQLSSLLDFQARVRSLAPGSLSRKLSCLLVLYVNPPRIIDLCITSHLNWRMTMTKKWNEVRRKHAPEVEELIRAKVKAKAEGKRGTSSLLRVRTSPTGG